MKKNPMDKDLLQRLYQENAQKLYFIARSIAQDQAKAEEAVYICFRKLSEDLALFRDQDYENLERLSEILVKNAAANMVDRQTREVRKVKVTDRNATDDCMDRAVWMLDEDERHLLFLQHVMQFSPKEIGSLLDMDPNETEKKILACSEKLKAALEEMSA